MCVVSCDIESAKVLLSVSVLRGILPPDEIVVRMSCRLKLFTKLELTIVGLNDVLSFAGL